MVNVNFRIKRHPRGWVVEVEKTICFLFFKRKRWVHAISAAGLDSVPWYYSSRESALNNLSHEIKSHIYWGEFFNRS